MNRTNGSRWRAARLWPGLALMLFAALPAQGQVNISVVATPSGGGMFHYAYAVTNASPPDVVIVSIEVPADPLAIDNLVAPAGFLASFDPGLGFLDLIANTEAFATGLEVGGFAFDSPFGPGDADYQALNLNGVFFSGTTTAPVPEPATALLFVSGVAVLIRGYRHASPRSRRPVRQGLSDRF